MTSAVSSSVPEFPLLKRQLTPRVVSGEGVVLRSEKGDHFLQGAVFEAVMPMLDGRTSVDAIVDRLGHVPASHVYYALLRLQGAQLIVDGGHEPTPDLAFWHALGTDLRPTPIRLDILGAIPHDVVHETLDVAGLRHEESAAPRVVLTDDYLRPEILPLNMAALADDTPLILCKPVGTIFWWGPVVSRRSAGCADCLQVRLRRTRPISSYLAFRGLDQSVVTPFTRASVAAATALFAVRFRSWLAGTDGDFAGNILTLDLASGETARFPVPRRPECPSCGDVELYARALGRPFPMGRGRKVFTADGGHRCVTPEETVARFEQSVNGLLGPILSVHKVPADAEGQIHLYVTESHGNPRPATLGGLFEGMRWGSAGKGLTGSQARASALGEAIERYAAVFQGNEPKTRATQDDLGDAGVDVHGCMLFSTLQYLERGAAGEAYEWVPRPLPADEPCDWTPVWSMTEVRPKFLPTAYLYLDHPPRGQEPFCLADSNGVAAGNTREEALLQAVMELFERDAVGIWWYNRVARPSADVHEMRIDGFDRIVAAYRVWGRDLWILDVTTDLGIPAFAAVSARAREATPEFLLGFGAHLDPRIAVSRALTEMSQMLSAWLGFREGAEVPAILRKWFEEATFENQVHLLPLAHRAGRSFDVPVHEDIADDIEWCRARLAVNNIELLVLDLTRPELGVPVVKAIAPGLRHFRRRLAPGRLYDVPVVQGWLPEARREEAMNPFPCFL